MSFEDILKNLVDTVPKAIGAILVDWEGEAVMEQCHCDPYDIRFIAAHEGIILARLKEMQSAAQTGEVEDVVVTSSNGHLIIGSIDQGAQVDKLIPLTLQVHQKLLRTTVGHPNHLDA